MNVREENAARALIQGFLKDSVPEYIKDTGQEILNSGGVHKLSIRKEGDTWTWKHRPGETSRTIRPT